MLDTFARSSGIVHECTQVPLHTSHTRAVLSLDTLTTHDDDNDDDDDDDEAEKVVDGTTHTLVTAWL